LRSGAIAADRVAPTQTLIFNARLDAAVCGVFLILVAVILIDSVRVWAGILRGTRTSQVVESPFVLSRLAEEV
jgi:carbon starvation protein